MASFIASHDVAYNSYFNADVDNVYPLDPSVAPLTVTAYRAAFAVDPTASTEGVVITNVLPVTPPTPPAGVPEAPSTILLPTSAALVWGGAVRFSRRRRNRRHARRHHRVARAGQVG